jgi:putative hydrolase of HD superfamily
VAAWTDYDEGSTPEARYMKEMDKFECMIQAHEYEQQTHGKKDLGEFQGLSSKIRSVEGKAWLELLTQERSAHQLKRKRKLSVVFVTGMAYLSRLSSILTSTGDLSVCETHCARLSKEFGFQHISLEHLLVEKSREQSYRWAEFLADCLREEIDVPVDLVISLLERKIVEGIEEKGWRLVCGFPKSIEQLLEFERKVSTILPLK